jgi:N-acetyl-gamma-glutamyl-phosphate reductase common form
MSAVARPGPMSEPVPVIVLGGSGYVAGELLRLLAGHPLLGVEAVASESNAGAAIDEVFPHLRGCFDERRLVNREDLLACLASFSGPVAIFSAAPHGSSAQGVAEALAACPPGSAPRVVDLSADFRFADPLRYERIYGHRHPQPELLRQFACGLPELIDGVPARHIGNPGCFPTAVSLAAAPLVALDLIEPGKPGEPGITAVAITGSTGSGRTPAARTHHPERRSNVVAYEPFTHRHSHEIEFLANGSWGRNVAIDFLPHSGPFARGIHATVQARLREDMSGADLLRRLREFYAAQPFVSVSDAPPALQSVVGTNRCVLSVAVRGRSVAVFSVIDNLVKGAAGGALQWMNRLLGFPETSGLALPGLGWL